jgi:hypothetical protein
VVTRALLLLAAACSSKAHPDGVGSSGAGSAIAAGSGSAGSGLAGSGSASSGSAGSARPAGPTHGEIQIRVEWADVPMAARASPGRTPCNTPRAPSVAPTTTWGIPDAVVIVEGAPADPAAPRIVLAECALSPRVAIGASLVVESAADRPTSVTLSRRADLPKLASPTLGGAAPRVLRLPIAGHAVAVSLDAGGVYELATADKDPETAWIVAPLPGAAIAATDATGQAVLHGVSPGAHAVTAWLPPRAGQPARIARGTVTVVPGALAELSLPLTPVP